MSYSITTALFSYLTSLLHNCIIFNNNNAKISTTQYSAGTELRPRNGYGQQEEIKTTKNH